jgi:molybdopterin-binding protein
MSREVISGVSRAQPGSVADKITDRAGVLVMKLSARNQIPATITAITAGEAIANVELDAGGTRLVASITVEAVRDLGLAVGSHVTAIIKASDVIVAVAD